MLVQAVDAVKALDLRTIGVCGVAGSGKDTVYEQVLQPLGFVRIGFAFPFKMELVASGKATFSLVGEQAKHISEPASESVIAKERDARILNAKLGLGPLIDDVMFERFKRGGVMPFDPEVIDVITTDTAPSMTFLLPQDIAQHLLPRYPYRR